MKKSTALVATSGFCRRNVKILCMMMNVHFAGVISKIILDFRGKLRYNILTVKQEGQIRGLCYGIP